MFNDDLDINGQSAIVVGDDVGACGIVSNYQKNILNKGIKLQDTLRLSLMDYDMTRPNKEE